MSEEIKGLHVRVYLDNCCFNRPFDDQSQTRIRLESEAKLCIQRQIRSGAVELAWSYILDYENDANPFEERRRTIAQWRQHARVDIDESEEVIQRAKALTLSGLKAKDALHLACATVSECDCFVTTDDTILKHSPDVKGIAIVDPVSLVRELDL